MRERQEMAFDLTAPVTPTRLWVAGWRRSGRIRRLRYQGGSGRRAANEPIQILLYL